MEILNHFVDNLPSVIAIILAMIAGWAIKEIFLKKNTLIEFEQKIKGEFQDKLDAQQRRIDTLEQKSHEQHSSITEVKTTLKHIAETLAEIKDHLFTRRRKKD